MTNGFEFISNEGASFDGPCNGEEDPGMYNGDSMPMYVVSTQSRPQMEEETNFTCGNVVACPLGTSEIYLEIVGPNNQVIPNWYLVLTNTQYSYIRDYIG